MTAISARALAPPEEISENYNFRPFCETELKRCTLRAIRGRVAITIKFPLVCIHKKNVLVGFFLYIHNNTVRLYTTAIDNGSY